MNIRIYHPDSIVENSTNLLSKEHTHYVANVMRLKRGSIVNLFNSEGEWESEIVFCEKERVEVKFLKKVKEPQKKNKIELAICLVKKNPMEIILQKATELGVGKIIPIISERTEVKELNNDRAKKIVIEATEQSNQMSPPEILKITKLNDFLKNLEVKEANIQNIYSDKIKREFNTIEGNNNSLFTDNRIKDVVLERELGLRNNINYNIEVANPQRFNEIRLKKNTNVSEK